MAQTERTYISNDETDDGLVIYITKEVHNCRGWDMTTKKANL